MEQPEPAPRPATPPPPPPPPEPPAARRIPVRNTPTLRSATREQLAEAREEADPTPAEPPDTAPEPEKDVKPSPARPACRKRARGVQVAVVRCFVVGLWCLWYAHFNVMLYSIFCSTLCRGMGIDTDAYVGCYRSRLGDDRKPYVCCPMSFTEAAEDDKKAEGPPEKSKRTWEKWSPSDKTVFFEALNDIGKNFQALQNYIAKKKMKNKSGQDQVRNRDQIRFFYYRTLNKISQYVQFPAGMWCKW